MNIVDTSIPEVKVVEPQVFGDERGFFFESYNKRKFSEAIGREVDFVQDNHSRSTRGVLRGLHYQLSSPQAKLVRCLRGAIYDVAVDIRKSSPTFGRWVGYELSEENKRQMWVPEGFAHGFLVLSEIADVAYKASDYYSPGSERCISWDDRELAIAWPLDEGVKPVLSEKDRRGQAFSMAELFD
ncbi:MAG: dTDP-4-dehydrorhamnose 3,5-epimerase [Thiohalomonadaceae bacterium]